MGNKVINIPISRLTWAMKSSSNLDLLALSVCIRCKYSNGVFMDVNQYKLRKTFKVGKIKADRLLMEARHSSLFNFETDTRMRCASLSEAVERTNKKGRRYKGEIVVKIECGDYSHSEMVNILRQRLLCFMICAKEHKDELILSQKEYGRADVSFLTQEKISKVLNVSIATVSRMVNKLSCEEVIKVTRSYRKYTTDKRNVYDCTRCLGMSAYRDVTYTDKYGNSYIVMPCKYAMTNDDLSRSYVHRIIGYDKRG